MNENVSLLTSLILISRIVSCVYAVNNNLLENGGFDKTQVENGFLENWSCQGEENDYIPCLQTMKDAFQPPSSGLCTERTNKTQGPTQEIQSRVIPDHLYKVQGWTRVLHGGMDTTAAMELWLRWKAHGQEKEEKKLLSLRNKYLKNDGWVFWKSQFHIPATQGFKYVMLYFKGPPRNSDILIDNMQLYEIIQQRNWRKDTDNQINRIRKRDVLIRLTFPNGEFTREQLAKTTLEVKQLTSQFGFGTSVFYDAIKRNEDYRKFVKENFDWATMEHALKWPYMEPIKGSVNYSMADTMMDILTNEMGMNVRGHCIFWAVPDEQPKWLINASSLAIKASLRRRLYNVLNRYKDKIDAWDVNNEMLHGTFFADKINSTVRDWMFFEAHKIFPDGKYFVNDYEVLSAPYYTQSYIEEVKRMIDRGVPVSGIGVQGHFTGAAHAEILKERLDDLATLGLPIWITELDVKNLNDVKRADSLDAIMRIGFAHAAVQGIMLWSFWDKHDWRGNTSLFSGKEFKPNVAGERYLNLRRQWKSDLSNTSPQTISNNEVRFSIRLFHGSYMIKLFLPDDSVVSKLIVVTNDARKLVLVFQERSQPIL